MTVPSSGLKCLRTAALAAAVLSLSADLFSAENNPLSAAAPAPDPASAVSVTEPARTEYRDKSSGNEAFRAGDFGTAASFYRKYRTEAERSGDQAALRDAFECEIDALIRGGIASEAEEVLNLYEKSFSGLNSLSLALWRANIRLLQRRIPEAEALLEKTLPSLQKNDTRRLQALSSMAYAQELKKDYAAAAKYYLELASMKGESPLVRSSLERAILMLAASGDTDMAMDKLKSVPLASTERDLFAIKLLSFYLQQIKNDPASDLRADWDALRKSAVPRKENLFFLAASLIADKFAAQKEYPSAAEAFRFAYDCAVFKADESDTLSRLIDVLEKNSDPAQAADLALAQYQLFQGASSPPGVKLRTSELLSAAGKFDSALAIAESVFDVPALCPAEKNAAFETAYTLFLKRAAFSHAERLSRHFYAKNTDDPNLKIHLAEILCAQKKLQPAADLYRQAGEAFGDGPERTAAWTRGAHIAFELKDYKNVLDFANRILQKNPGDSVLFLRAAAFENLGDKKRALADYLAYTALPDAGTPPVTKAESLFRAARLQLSAGKTNEAAEAFRKILREYPETTYAPAAGYWLVHTYAAAGDDLNAEKETWILTEKYPDSEYTFSASLWLASRYAQAGVFSRAEAAIENAASQKKHPKIRARALYEKAILSYKGNNFQQAEASVRELESQFPDDVNLSAAYYLLGDIRREDGKFEEAVSFYMEAAKRRPRSPLEQASWGAAGDCYFALGSKTDKTELYRKAIDCYAKIRSSANPLREYEAMAIYKTARCLQFAGDDAAAFPEYKKMLYLFPAKEAQTHPSETVWVVKAAEALNDLAAKLPLGEQTDAAVSALAWLGNANLLDADTVHRRIRILRKKKYRPIIQEIHKK